ncbi:hypothetical protein VP01_4704g2 [Puccinia sorghi]|uniref:Uncharacterized protein n=1 Tax=Puccinia sorghi TaxID=27349 RepID=A0A0L6UN20_9BASI|nr:hypothetical protein VP01_4704g2 [Puccinia sorghi]
MTTLAAARKWTDATQTARKKLVKQTGVRTSELNRLTYWDPVKNVVLGIMHNWFEGVLQHHFRYRWGINSNINKQTESDAKESEAGTSDYLTEEVTENDDEEENVSPGRSFWNIDQKKKLISCVREVVVPTGVTQMPIGLGTAKNSKLKASKWHTLFAIHLPLAAISVFVDSEPIEKCLAKNEEAIENFIAVVRCTNIVGLDKVRKEDSEKFTLEYSKYTSSAENIFPNIKRLPNHHYTLHIPEQMRWWGPLLEVSEFPGEQLIGKLQKCKTNRNTKQTPMTMMEKFCQAQRLQALHGLDCVLAEEKSIRGGAKFELSKGAYQEILGFCRQATPDLRSCADFPHPDGAKVMFTLAKEVHGWDCGRGMRISKHTPNNMIQYDTTDGHAAYGQVTNVVQVTGYRWAGTTYIQLLPAREFQHSNCLGDILRRLSVLHVQLGTPRYIYLPACHSLWPVNNDAMIIDL